MSGKASDKHCIQKYLLIPQTRASKTCNKWIIVVCHKILTGATMGLVLQRLIRPSCKTPARLLTQCLIHRHNETYWEHELISSLVAFTIAINKCAAYRTLSKLQHNGFCTILAAQAVPAWHKNGAFHVVHADHTVCVIMLMEGGLLRHPKRSRLHILRLLHILHLHTAWQCRKQLSQNGSCCIRLLSDLSHVCNVDHVWADSHMGTWHMPHVGLIVTALTRAAAESAGAIAVHLPCHGSQPIYIPLHNFPFVVRVFQTLNVLNLLLYYIILYYMIMLGESDRL